MTIRGLQARRWMALMPLVAVSGCSLLNGPRQVVQVRSTPSGAAVMLDGAPAGVTPVDVRVLRHNADPVLRIEKDGFEHVDRELERGFSALFKGDLLLAGFFGSAFVFGAGLGGASAGGVVGMGALGVALVLGPAFAMGSPFGFPEEVDVSLTPLADGTDPAAVSRESARSMAFDSELDLVDLHGDWSRPEGGHYRAWLRERLHAVRVGVDGGGVVSEAELVQEGHR